MMMGASTCDDGNTIAGRRLQRRLPGRAGLRLPDAGPRLPPDGLRRRRQGGRRVVRRRQHLSAATAAAPTAGPSRSARAPCGCTSPCGDGLKLPDEECDDGNTRLGRRLLAPPASSSRAGTARTSATPTTATWSCRSSTATSCTATRPAATRTSAPGVSGTVVTGMVQATLARGPQAGDDRRRRRRTRSLTTAADFAAVVPRLGAAARPCATR